MRRRLTRQQRQRVTFDTPYGPARGISVTVDIGGQQVHVRYAVDAAIDQYMTQQAEAIADAQFSFAERLTSFEDPYDASAKPGLQTGATLFSATPDGSIFSISTD